MERDWSVTYLDQFTHGIDLTACAGAGLQLVTLNTQTPVLVLLDIEAGVEVTGAARFFEIDRDHPPVTQEQYKSVATAGLNASDPV